MGFSRQEYWSGLPRSPPGDLPDPGIKSTFPSPMSPGFVDGFFTNEPRGKPPRWADFSAFLSSLQISSNVRHSGRVLDWYSGDKKAQTILDSRRSDIFP